MVAKKISKSLFIVISSLLIPFGTILNGCTKEPQGSNSTTSSNGSSFSESVVVTMTFDSMGGSVCTSISQTPGTALTLPTPIRVGYEFKGWYLDSSFSDDLLFTATVMPNESVTLYAKWEKEKVEYNNDNISATNFSIWDDGETYDVEEKLIIKYSSDEVDVTGSKLYNLNTGITVKKSGHIITWYSDPAYTSVLETQRVYLDYGDNIYFATISNPNGQFICSYAINLYVLQDYFYTYYEYQPNYLFADQMDDYKVQKVRENDRVSPVEVPNNSFEFVEWVTYQNTLNEYGPHNWDIPASSSLTFYASYKDVILDLGDEKELKDFHYKPYSTTKLPVPSSTSTHFFNGYWYNGIQYFDSEGNALKPVSLSELRQLKAEFLDCIPDNYFEFTKIDDGYSIKLNSIPENVTIIIIPDKYNGEPITTIGKDAFKNYNKITEIIVPDSITSIESSAFEGCNSLQKITIPFMGEKSDSKVNAHLGYLFGAKSFLYNEEYIPQSLKEVIVKNGDSVGNQAFYNCRSLTNIEIPNNITKIGDYAFYNCSSLLSIDVPNSVTNIGKYAFYNCNLFTSINIPNGVTSIGDYTFYNCNLLESIEIPSTVETIGNSAFGNCNLITNIVIPKTVTKIDKFAFAGCSSLQEITLPFVGMEVNGTSNTHFGYIFGADSYVNNKDFVPSSLKKVTITGGNSIGNHAFYNCNFLTNIVLPNSVICIEESAFQYCNSLKDITLPNGVKSIGNYAFSGCSSITSIVISNSVISMGNSVFSNCNLLTIFCEASSKIDGWNNSWNPSNRPVYWSGEWNYDSNGNPIPNN